MTPLSKPGKDSSGRRLLTLVKPPKPVSQMTDAELDAFADQIFETAAAANQEAGSEPEGPKPAA